MLVLILSLADINCLDDSMEISIDIISVISPISMTFVIYISYRFYADNITDNGDTPAAV